MTGGSSCRIRAALLLFFSLILRGLCFDYPVSLSGGHAPRSSLSKSSYEGYVSSSGLSRNMDILSLRMSHTAAEFSGISFLPVSAPSQRSGLNPISHELCLRSFKYSCSHNPTLVPTLLPSDSPNLVISLPISRSILSSRGTSQDLLLSHPISFEKSPSPSPKPTPEPSEAPSSFPSSWPSTNPSFMPSSHPSSFSFLHPTPSPTTQVPTYKPTAFSNFDESLALSIAQTYARNASLQAQFTEISVNGISSPVGGTWRNFSTSVLNLELNSVPTRLVFGLITPSCSTCSSLRLNFTVVSCAAPQAVNSLWKSLVFSQPTSVNCNNTQWTTRPCESSNRICLTIGRFSSIPSSSTSFSTSSSLSLDQSAQISSPYVAFLGVIVSPKIQLWPTWSQASTPKTHSITVRYTLSSPGIFQCAAFVSSSPITSVLSIVQPGNPVIFANDQTLSGNITLGDLQGQTNYTVYCFSQSYANRPGSIFMASLSQVLKLSNSVQTKCCARSTILLSSTMTNLTPLKPSSSLVLTVKNLPVDPLVVEPVLFRLSRDICTTQSLASSFDEIVQLDSSNFAPNRLSFSSTLGQKAASFVVIVPDVGCYAITAKLSGLSSSDFVLKATSSIAQMSNGSFIFFNSYFVPDVSSLQVLYFSFINYGSQVEVVFSFSTDMGFAAGIDLSSTFPCSLLFVFEGATASACSFVQYSKVLITLPQRSFELPRIADQVIVLGDIIKPLCSVSSSGCSEYPYLPQTTAIITSSDTNPPVVIITGPNQLFVGYSLTLSIASSSGNGGRPWDHISWDVTANFDNRTLLDPIEVTLNSQSLAWINCIPGTLTCDTLPASLFQQPGVYIFALTLTNFLGMSATSRISVLVVDEVAQPQVTILESGPTSIFPNTTLTIQSHLSSYGVTDPILYNWLVFKNDEIDISVSSSSNDVRQFVVPPFVLKPGSQYTFRVSIIVNGVVVSFDEASFLINFGNVVPAMSAPLYITIGAPLDLDASASFSTNTADNSDLEFHWNCVQIMPFRSTGCDEFYRVAASMYPTSTQGISSPILKFPNSALILNASMQYLFTVSLQSTLVATSSSILNVIIAVQDSNHTVPSINISPPTSVIDNSNSLIVDAWVSYPSGFIAVWSISTINRTISTTTFRGSGDQYVPCLGHPFLFPPDSRYTLQLRAYPLNCPHCQPSVRKITVFVNQPPFGGYATANPLRGDENTLFTLYALNWQDNNLPLSYSYFQSNNPSDQSTFRLIRQRSVQSYTSSYLVPGRGIKGNTTYICVLIFDSFNSQTLTHFNVSVYHRPYAVDSSILNFVVLSLSVASNQKNSDSLLMTTNLVASYLDLEDHPCNQRDQGDSSGGSNNQSSPMEICSMFISAGVDAMSSALNLASQDKYLISSLTGSLSTMTSSLEDLPNTDIADASFSILSRISQSSSLMQISATNRFGVLNSYLNCASNLIDSVIGLNNSTQETSNSTTRSLVSRDSNVTVSSINTVVQGFTRNMLAGFRFGEILSVQDDEYFEIYMGKSWSNSQFPTIRELVNVTRGSQSEYSSSNSYGNVGRSEFIFPPNVTSFGFLKIKCLAFPASSFADDVHTEFYAQSSSNITDFHTIVTITNNVDRLDVFASSRSHEPTRKSYTCDPLRPSNISVSCSSQETFGPEYLFGNYSCDSNIAAINFTCPLYESVPVCYDAINDQFCEIIYPVTPTDIYQASHTTCRCDVEFSSTSSNLLVSSRSSSSRHSSFEWKSSVTLISNQIKIGNPHEQLIFKRQIPIDRPPDSSKKSSRSFFSKINYIAFIAIIGVFILISVGVYFRLRKSSPNIPFLDDSEYDGLPEYTATALNVKFDGASLPLAVAKLQILNAAYIEENAGASDDALQESKSDEEDNGASFSGDEAAADLRVSYNDRVVVTSQRDQRESQSSRSSLDNPSSISSSVLDIENDIHIDIVSEESDPPHSSSSFWSWFNARKGAKVIAPDEEVEYTVASEIPLEATVLGMGRSRYAFGASHYRE